jgi:hypothetical protein
MPEPSENPSGAQSRESSNPYRHLPDSIRLEDTVTSKESDAPPDPSAGRDTERDFMLRYAG